MYIDEKKSSSLAIILSKYDITILDTCSLMEDGFLHFADTLKNAKVYLDNNNEIIIIKSCYKELKRHSKDEINSYKRINALRALKVVNDLRKERIVKIKNIRSNRNFADNVIFTFVSQSRINNSILVVTQDKNLCQDIKNLNSSLSQEGKLIVIDRISDNGYLEENYGRPNGFNPRQPIVNRPIVKKPFLKQKATISEKSNEKVSRTPLRPTKKSPYKPLENNKTKTISLTLEEVLIADTKLSADISNPNVLTFKKIELIHDQLDRIEKLSSKEKENLTLNYPLSRLNSSLSSLQESLNKVKNAEKIPAKKVVKPIIKSADPEILKNKKPVAADIVLPKKEEEKKPVAKKSSAKSSKTVSKPVSKKSPTKPSHSKDTAKKVSFDDLLTKEKRLLANLSNPTYSKENKIKDLESFKKDISSFTTAELKGLKLTKKKVNETLKDLKK